MYYLDLRQQKMFNIVFCGTGYAGRFIITQENLNWILLSLVSHISLCKYWKKIGLKPTKLIIVDTAYEYIKAYSAYPCFLSELETITAASNFRFDEGPYDCHFAYAPC